MREEELASFVPTWLTSRLPSPHEGQLAQARMPGSLVFADVSGFSALAMALAERHGPAGAERLSIALDTFFGMLLSAVRERGGEVASFAGDGLLACFLAVERSPRDAALAAADAALAMVHAVGSVGSVEGVTIGLHAAVSSGELSCLATGGHRGAWQALVLGDPIRQLRRVFPGTTRGQSVASAEAMALLEHSVVASPIDAERSLLLGVHAPPPAPPERARTVGDVSPWLPEVIRARAGVPLGGWMADLRTLTALFVSLPDADADGGEPRLAAAVRVIQEELDAHHGTLHQVTVDEKGVAVTCAFGLPGPQTDRPAASAVRCALTLAERLRHADVRAGLGLATGRAFVGPVGDERRRELAIVGRAMIDAARLAVAQLGVAVDAPTRDAAEDEVDFEPGPEVPTRAGSVASFRARSRRRATLRASVEELVGRRAVLAALDAALDAHARGESSVIVLEGPAGIGKSRLAAHLAARARRDDVSLVTALGDRASADRPYHAWRAALESRLGIEHDAPPATRIARATAVAGDDEAPLLGPVLGVTMKESALTRSLEAQGRAAHTAERMAQLLAGGPRRVLVVDDAQWLDGASVQVLEAARALPGACLLLMCVRVPGRPLRDELAALRDAPGTRHFVLPPLSESEVEQLVAARLGLRHAPGALAHWVAQRSLGNPFFAREVTASLVSRGAVEVEQGRLVREPDLDALERAAPPASIEAMIAARIDALPVAAQLAVKAASVLGMRFHLGALAAVHPMGVEAAREGLEVLCAAGLCQQVEGEREVYLHAHRIVHDVAYGLVAFELRATLHAHAAAWMEAHAPGESASVAYHWERAGDRRRALRWLEAAWADADRAGALSETHALGRRALALAEGASDEERARWLRRQADASANLSMYARAIDEAREALAALGRPLPTEPRAWRRRLAGGAVVQLAHAILPRSLWRRGRTGDAEAAQALTRAAEGFYFVQGDQLPALTCFLESANAAERAHAVGHVPNSYGIVGLALASAGLHRLARSYLSTGLGEASALGEARNVASAHFHLASFEAMRGAWAAADAHHAECAALCERSGNRFLLVFVLSARAMNTLLRGRLGAAEAVASELLALSEPMRQERGIAVARHVLATVALLRGELTRAVETAERARDALVARGDLTWTLPAATRARALLASGATSSAVLEACSVLDALGGTRPPDYRRLDAFAGPAEVLLRAPDQPQGRIAAALRLARTFARAHPLGWPRYHLLCGLAAEREGKPKKALDAYARSLGLATERGLGLCEARARIALARLRGDASLAVSARRWVLDERVDESVIA